MKKDIPNHKVEALALAIVPREDNQGADDDLWDAYLINLQEAPISNVLISSRGYGSVNGDRMKTTTLRYFYDEVPGLHIEVIEPIQVKLFNLTNEYWVSFSYEGYMYDEKYVFAPGSISEENFSLIPFLDKKGVMIR